MTKSFPLPIPDRLYFRIGDVAEIVGVKPYVLRYWETEFPMISPQKSASGQRVYRRGDVETVLLIRHLLYVERYSIDGARRRIRELRREGELKTYVARLRPEPAEPEAESVTESAAASPLPAPGVSATPTRRRIEQAAAAAAAAAHHSAPPEPASGANPGVRTESPFRFSDLGEAMSEARELAQIAAERALGTLGMEGIFEEPPALSDWPLASSDAGTSAGALAAGAPLPMERGEQAVQEFGSENLTDILHAAGDLKELADSPISQLYP